MQVFDVPLERKIDLLSQFDSQIEVQKIAGLSSGGSHDGEPYDPEKSVRALADSRDELEHFV